MNNFSFLFLFSYPFSDPNGGERFNKEMQEYEGLFFPLPPSLPSYLFFGSFPFPFLQTQNKVISMEMKLIQSFF